LAPLALAATIAGIYLIVSHGLHTGSAAPSSRSSGSSHNGSGTGTSQTNRTPTSTRAGGPASYVVRSGDTLSEIALRTHVPVATIERLNPRISANSLRVGQRLRLRR
jgi:LysM repeat protein